MKVAILGCGPAGLMAAHAAVVAGAEEVRIYSKRRKSEMFGAQYLHAPIPGMTDTAPVEVSYELVGTHEQYRVKVYGDQASLVPSVSPQDLGDTHSAWDIRRTYDNLWQQYSGSVFNTTLTPRWARECVDSGLFDLVFSTVPMPVLCEDARHRFIKQRVWAMGDAPERGIFVPEHLRSKRNAILCNGLAEEPWYRIANVYGYSTVEWPHDAPLRTNIGQYDPSEVAKPIATTCDCHPEIIRLGRYGKWSKKELSHNAYEDVLSRVSMEPVTS